MKSSQRTSLLAHYDIDTTGTQGRIAREVRHIPVSAEPPQPETWFARLADITSGTRCVESTCP